MASELGELRVAGTLVRLDRARDLSMPRRQFGRAERRLDGVADERVHEAELTGYSRRLDQTGGDCFVEVFEARKGGATRCGRDQSGRERPPDDRSDPYRVDAAVRPFGEAPHDRVSDRLRHRREIAARGEMPCQLADIQGVAPGRVDDRVDNRIGRGLRSDRTEQRGDAGAVQSGKLQPFCRRRPHDLVDDRREAGDLIGGMGSVRRSHEHRRVADAIGDVGQQAQ